MDKGCFVKQKLKRQDNTIYEYHLGDISMVSFDKKSVKNLQLCFLQYGIKSYIYKTKRLNGHGLRFNRENLYKLCKLIYPYVKQIPSMHYKINYLQSELYGDI